jgi:hypothetical protein
MNHLIRHKSKLVLVGFIAALAVVCSSAYAVMADGPDAVPDSGIDLDSTTAAIRADSSAMMKAVQPLIVDCMSKLGFVYVPGDMNNGKSLSASEQAQWNAAMEGSKRIEFKGLFGQRGSYPADGCVADSRSRVAGGLQAYVDISTARHDVDSLHAYIQSEIKDGKSRDEAVHSATVQSHLPEIVERWQAARAKGVAQLGG